MIECERITVSYGATIAADRVSFRVGDGEVLGLLGPNGAGKTSVIRALTTIIEPDSGDATIDGISLREPARVRERIGVLPESTGYPGARTGLELLTFHGRLFGADARHADQRAVELLERVGLRDHANRRIATFSRGMRQRLGIARALVNRPRALFLDEPTLGLDPAGKSEILDHLREDARESGTAIVLCSHLLDEVERVCDRVAILHGGRVVAGGSVTEVVAQAQVLGGARLDVAPDAVVRTVNRLNSVEGLRASGGEMAGRIDVDFRPDGPQLVGLAGVLAHHDLAFTALESRGARLSDAFLQLTGASNGLAAP